VFIGYETEGGGLKITVREGTNKPYYLSDKGIRPSGVYVRQGASSVPASFEQIREMIKLTDGDNFETARSLLQKLTFNICRRTDGSLLEPNNVTFRFRTIVKQAIADKRLDKYIRFHDLRHPYVKYRQTKNSTFFRNSHIRDAIAVPLDAAV
jgi:hypothetical protein